MNRPGTDAGRPEPSTLRGVNGVLWGGIASAAARTGTWPWWVQAGGIYAIARLASACIFMAAALHQGVNPWFPAGPDYWNFINIWDARWYGEIVRNGYPAELPLDSAGNVKENAWAFYALFPLLGRAVTAVTGIDPALSLTLIAMAAGLGASLVVYRLFRLKASHVPALWGVVFFSTFPVSPVLQVPYAESLGVLLLASALLLVLRRRYLWAIPVVALMCLARPIGVPFAVMVACLFVYRAWQRHRTRASGPDRQGSARPSPADGPARPGRQPHSLGELLSLAALAVVSALGALAWPAIAWAVTGDPAAYTKTETVWRGNDLVPFKPWFDTGIQLFGPVLGVLAPFVFVIAFALLMTSAPVVSLGTVLRLWCICYMGYLLVFLHPQTSTFRMLLPLFPLALSTALISRSRAYRGAVVIMFVLLQIVWIVWLWAWAQLPGGGDYPP